MSERYGAFREEWDAFASLNLQDLMPWVADPTAPIHRTSALTPGQTKTPSLIVETRHGAGVVGLRGWSKPTRITTKQEMLKWREDDRLGICMNGRKIKCIDIDVPDLVLGPEVEAFIREQLGPLGMLLPLRDREGTGKRALMYRLADAQLSAYNRVVLRGYGEFNRSGGAIEFLADTKQFVVAGRHESGQRYRWPEGIPSSLDAIPVFEKEEIEALYHALQKEFGANGVYAAWHDNIHHVDRATGQRNEYKDDPIVQYLLENELLIDYAPNGGVFVTCPWEHMHGQDTKLDAAEFFPKGSNGRIEPGFSCFHAHSKLDTNGKPLAFNPTCESFLEAIGYRALEIDAEFEVIQAADAPQPLAATRPKFTFKGRSKVIENTISNVTAMLRWEGGGYRLRYDKFKDIILYRRVDDASGKWSVLDDDTYTAIRIEFAKRGMETPSHETMQRAVSFIARENAVDTAQEWLLAQKWDGQPRVRQFHTRVLRLSDTPYHKAVCDYIWTALAGRILDPGCKADMVPILTGKQGLRKSSLVEALAPTPDEYTVVTLADRDDNLARQLRGRMVVEWDELRGLNSRDAESLKGWVSRRKDDWIPKFKEFGITMMRRFVLIGTANPSRFLNDPTGLRRWLPLKITKPIDVDYVIANRNQLWAEACSLWRDEFERTMFGAATGVMWADAEALAKDAQREASIRDPWVDAVQSWFVETDGVGPWSALEILNQACNVPIAQINFGTQERLRRVMAFMQWEESSDARWSPPLV